jgi:xylulokinase
VLAAAFRSVDTVFTTNGAGPDGGAEQDAELWWTGTLDAIDEVLDAMTLATPSTSPCSGIGITGQWGSTVPVDAACNPVGPCLLWSDHRGERWSKRIAGGPVAVAGYGPFKIARWLRLAGGAPNPNGADPTGHAQFLEHERPAVVAASSAMLEPVDFIGAKLTGRIAATPASMVASWLTDNRVGAAVVYDDTLVRLARRRVELLPELRPTGSALGPLTAAVAERIDQPQWLPAGTPVVCGVPDLHTAAIGAGAVGDFAGHISISTTAWVSAPVPFKKTDIIHQMASVPGLRTGSYLIANNHETGGAALRWLRDAVLTPEGGFDGGYDALTAEAATAQPGSGGVIFCPWLSGERSPVSDANLRASFLNVSMSTTRADLVRSVLEGVALNARWLLEATESFAGRPLDGLRLLGGGATSPLWCQIHADVIGRPILQVSDPVNVNVRGAAWFAALHLGHMTLSDIDTATPPAEVFEPVAASTATYGGLYCEFVRLAKIQRPMYKRLNGAR